MVAVVDDFAHFTGANRATVHRVQNRLRTMGDHRHLTVQHDINLLKRRRVRPRAATRQKLRIADPLVEWPAILIPLQPQPDHAPVVGRVIRFGIGKAAHQHQIASPASMR